MTALRSRHRATLCVRSCQGIPSEALEAGALKQILRLARAALELQQAAELADLPLVRRALVAFEQEVNP